MISPTVGRKVWYRPSHQDKNVGTESTPPMMVSGDQPLDATVVAVWADRLVNLVIFDVYGNQYARRSVPLKQEGDTIPEGQAYAEWMPYQVGQAKKSEPTIAIADTRPPHQQRVMSEKADLDERLAKLVEFCKTPLFAVVDEAEQLRLRAQKNAMTCYSEILDARIAAF